MSLQKVPLVTVLIPTFNRSDRLTVAINSVLNQTCKNLQLFVFDNASTDSTQEVVANIAKADSRVFYFRHQENIGMNENFNFALTKVDTPYFSFLSDDDYYDEAFIENGVILLTENQGVHFACFEGPEIDSESKRTLRKALDLWPREGVYQPGEAARLVLNGNHFIISACLFRKETLPAFYFDNKVYSISDFPVIVTLAANYSFYVSKKIAMYFIRHGEALGTRVDLVSWSRLDKCLLNLAIPEKTKMLVSNILTPRIDDLLVNHLYFYDDNKSQKEFLNVTKLIFKRKNGYLIIFNFYRDKVVKKTINLIIKLKSLI